MQFAETDELYYTGTCTVRDLLKKLRACLRVAM
jgi:hypothetical protein